MPNYIWFLILCLLSSGIYIYTNIKKHDPVLLPYWLFLSGFVYLLEYVVMILWDSYKYKPEVLSNPYYDSILGSIASNLFAVPMTAVARAALNIRWMYLVPIVLLFLGIEHLFTSLNIYVHHWWTLYHTAIGLTIFFTAAPLLLKYLIWSTNHKLHQWFVLTIIAFVLISTISFVLFGIFHLYTYEIGWFQNAARDHTSASVIINMISSISISWVSLRPRWTMILLAVCFLICVQLILQMMDILQLSSHWHVLYFTMNYVSLFGCIIGLKHIMITRGKRNPLSD